MSRRDSSPLEALAGPGTQAHWCEDDKGTLREPVVNVDGLSGHLANHGGVWSVAHFLAARPLAAALAEAIGVPHRYTDHP